MVEYNIDNLDPAFLALSDPTRRAILARLLSGEKRVTDVAAPFDMSLNAVSKHIKKLEQAGLVRRRKQGRTHFLSADPAPLDQMTDWIAVQKAAWNARLDRLETLIKAEVEDDE